METATIIFGCHIMFWSIGASDLQRAFYVHIHLREKASSVDKVAHSGQLSGEVIASAL